MTDHSSVGEQASVALAATSPLQIGLMKPGEEAACDDFVRSSPAGTFFHLSGWRAVVREVFGHETVCFVARRETRIAGILPVCFVRSRLFGSCLVSLPLAVYGGICADDRESYVSLLRAGAGLADDSKVKYLELRNRWDRFTDGLPGRDLYVTFTQDLTPGTEKLLQKLPRDTRYMVRKSLKSGLAWTEDLTLEEFYQIYGRSVHRLGTPVFPRELFASFLRTFPGQCRIFGVRKGRVPVAGVLCFYFKDQVLPYYGGSLAEFATLAPNNFMYWSLMAQSCGEGLRTFDFGRSKRETGSFHFKSSWSMQMDGLPYRYHLAGADQVPEMSPVDKKFRAAVSLWKRLPFPIAQALGPNLIRRIPSI